MQYMKNKKITLVMLVVVAANATAVPEIRTFANGEHLKFKDGSNIERILTAPLLSEQGNIATGTQTVSFSLDSTAQFPVIIDKTLIRPGETITFNTDVDSTGRLNLSVKPQASGKLGKAKFDITVKNVISSKDKIWEDYDDLISEWTFTGDETENSDWIPLLNRQMKNFTQTRSHFDTYSQNIQKRRIDENSGIIELVGESYTETERRKVEESRLITAEASEFKHIGTPYNCGQWQPPTISISQGTSFNQTRNCSQKQSQTWSYYTPAHDLLGQHEFERIITVSSSRTAVGTKMPQFAWNRIGRDSIEENLNVINAMVQNGTMTRDSSFLNRVCSKGEQVMLVVSSSTPGEVYIDSYECQ